MGLLDILAERMECMYLSDLCFLSRPNTMLRQTVASMPLDDFSEDEWIDAAEYLCGITCVSAKEAKTIIQERA